jgi:hypothetical protein
MNRRSGFLLAVCLVPLVSACGTEEDERIDDLAAARAQWIAAAPAAYDFEYLRSCFCPDVFPARVYVDAGVVTLVLDLESSTPLPADRNDDFPTVEQLFIELEELIRLEPFRLEVRYDPALGYPSYASVDIEERIVDEEFSYTVDDLVASIQPEVLR